MAVSPEHAALFDAWDRGAHAEALARGRDLLDPANATDESAHDARWLAVLDLVETAAFAQLSDKYRRAWIDLTRASLSAAPASFWARDVAALALDVLADRYFGPQLGSDFTGDRLRARPDDEEALDRFLRYALGDGGYLHRGSTLADVARSVETAPPFVRARLLLAQGMLEGLAHGSAARATPLVREALVVDPELDYDAMRLRCARCSLGAFEVEAIPPRDRP